MLEKFKPLSVLFFAIFLVLNGCGSKNIQKDNETHSNSEQQEENETTENIDGNEQGNSETAPAGENDYPLPIMDGWEEIEISFKEMGDGKINMWGGEFSYEGEISEYFEPYQKLLLDAGFTVEVTDDAEGLKSLSFEKEIDGKKATGNALFNQRWVKSSLQVFK